jgi:hypothetical protein
MSLVFLIELIEIYVSTLSRPSTTFVYISQGLSSCAASGAKKSRRQKEALAPISCKLSMYLGAAYARNFILVPHFRDLYWVRRK